MVTISECPLCGSKKIEKFYEGIDQYYSGRQVQCMVCSNCSLILLNPRPTEEEYKNWYESVFQDKRRNLETVEQVVAGIVRKNKYKKKLKQLKYFKDFIDNNSRCLEIGCGWGTLARVVKDKFNCEIDVIEPSKLAAKVAQEHFGLNVYQGDFDSFIDQGHNSKKYNFIYSYHVFEHIIDPNIFLEKIKKILNINGVLLLALPNTLNPEQPSERLFHIEHCFYYTPKTLSLILRKHGFEIIKIWLDKRDMKILCQPAKDNLEINFINDEIDLIRRKQNNIDAKYKFYRNIKKIFFYFLSDKQKDKINNMIIKIIRRR